MSEDQQRYLEAMGIPVWVRREHDAVAEENTPATQARSQAETGKEADSQPPLGPSIETSLLDWEPLAARVAGCTLCELSRSRTRTVFGVGNRSADLMIVGEAPGGEEDRQGEPFVGPAGKLLNAMLAAIGLQRDDVYIANILKCRPPRNRDPQASEVACCEPYLRRQIQLVGPRLILAVGRIAAQNLLDSTSALGRLRGQKYTYRDLGVPLIVTYHPAYLLRSPDQKPKAWEDLKFVRAELGKNP